MTRRVLVVMAGAEILVGVAACAQRSRPSTPGSADSVEVGYGAFPKDKVTGAVTTLSENDISAGPLQIEELLRGKVAGLEIIRDGERISFRIRGTNSLSAEQEPLVIVDDVMIQSGNIANALAGLTPDDIAQVNVMKDIASTSIYGARGAGGVILITTKPKRENHDD